MSVSPEWISAIVASCGAMLAGVVWIEGRLRTTKDALELIIRQEIDKQNEYRHNMATRITVQLDGIEQKVLERIDRLERLFMKGTP